MYAILQRQNLSPREPAAILVRPSVEELQRWLPLDGAEWSADIETKGTDATDPDSRIVGIGFANDRYCLYVDLEFMEAEPRAYLREFLLQAPLNGFNIFFDGAFLQQWTGRWLNWTQDLYGLFKQLSGEGWPGQKWTLKVAQTDVLGWDQSNKATLEAVLKERGLTKADMWQVEPAILGAYCAADADSTWQLRGYLNECAARLP